MNRGITLVSSIEISSKSSCYIPSPASETARTATFNYTPPCQRRREILLTPSRCHLPNHVPSTCPPNWLSVDDTSLRIHDSWLADLCLSRHKLTNSTTATAIHAEAIRQALHRASVSLDNYLSFLVLSRPLPSHQLHRGPGNRARHEHQLGWVLDSDSERCQVSYERDS